MWAPGAGSGTRGALNSRPCLPPSPSSPGSSQLSLPVAQRSASPGGTFWGGLPRAPSEQRSDLISGFFRRIILAFV